ncbi:Ribonuclease [Desulfonema limicola]|uniref:Ribonuclease VapC n=1 Tax=Desulfonema limicola TaxID=45656 RepID=A0A975B545_9BACT|nr:type II toxin-antitoxin system VapC family toxin [Desulfonema limicola]QTA78949.1 Ribonuclease [Desulfonema limicola]
MTYLLDTNVCIKYLNASSEVVKRHIEKYEPSEIVICSVVKSELFAGAYKSKNKEKTLDKLKIFFAPLKSLTFNDKAAKAYGKIRAELEKKGTPIGPYDLQIASIAIVNDLVLVSHNKREFSRVEGLKIEDWE